MKTCTLCQKSLTLDNFNKKNTSKDGLQNVCKECNREKSQAYYKANKNHHSKSILARKKVTIKLNKEKVNEIKKSGCSICSETSICTLDFHHMDAESKDNTVSRLLAIGCSFSRILNEIEKCILVCSNCHRKIHAGEISASARTRTEIVQGKNLL